MGKNLHMRPIRIGSCSNCCCCCCTTVHCVTILEEKAQPTRKGGGEGEIPKGITPEIGFNFSQQNKSIQILKVVALFLTVCVVGRQQFQKKKKKKKNSSGIHNNNDDDYCNFVYRVCVLVLFLPLLSLLPKYTEGRRKEEGRIQAVRFLPNLVLQSVFIICRSFFIFFRCC